MKRKQLKRVKNFVKRSITRLNETKRAKKVLREELVTAAAGFVALVSAAGGMAALQMKMENPEYKEKHPKLAAFLDILGELGAEASKARTREQEGEEEGGDGKIDDEELNKIEDELESMFDLKCDIPTPSAEKPEAGPVNERITYTPRTNRFNKKGTKAKRPFNLLEETKRHLKRRK